MLGCEVVWEADPAPVDVLVRMRAGDEVMMEQGEVYALLARLLDLGPGEWNCVARFREADLTRDTERLRRRGGGRSCFRRGCGVGWSFVIWRRMCFLRFVECRG